MPTDRIEGLTTERFASIISVALDEFASARYNDASFNRIIKNCQMAKGTMYYYFKSKEDLFLTIHKATLRDFRKVSTLALEPVESPSDFWHHAEELLLEFYRTIFRRPSASQFVTNFLTQESRREGHPAIATVNAIDEWLKDFLYRGQELGAIRGDLSLEQLTTLAWGIWESCRTFLPSEANRMQAAIHPEVILNLFQRVLTPIDEAAFAPGPEVGLAAEDPDVEAAFGGVSPEELPESRDATDDTTAGLPEKVAGEAKIAHLLASFKDPS